MRKNAAHELVSGAHRWQQCGGVEDEGQFRGDVNEGGEQRVKEAEGGEADADAVDDKRADEVLQDGATAATGGVEGVDEVVEITADEDDVLGTRLRGGIH